MKKIISLLIVLCLMASLCSMSAFAEETVPLPTASMTDITDTYDQYGKNAPPLTFARMFSAVTPSAEQVAAYGKWGADFVLTINKDIRWCDGYLAGSYDAYDSGEWQVIGYPGTTDETLAVSANQPIELMAMIFGARAPYELVKDYVQDFRCGVFLTDEFLEANPDLKINLELRLYPVKEGVDTTGWNYLTDINNFESYHMVITESKFTNPMYPDYWKPKPTPTPPPPPPVPMTADNSNMPLWGVLFIGFAAVAVLTAKKKKA